LLLVLVTGKYRLVFMFFSSDRELFSCFDCSSGPQKNARAWEYISELSSQQNYVNETLSIFLNIWLNVIGYVMSFFKDSFDTVYKCIYRIHLCEFYKKSILVYRNENNFFENIGKIFLEI